MRILNHTRRGAAAAVIGALLVIILAAVIAYFALKKTGTGDSALDMARLMPADSQVAWGWNLSGQLDYVGWAEDFKAVQKDLPESAQNEFAEFEKELGMSLEAWLRMYDGRGFVAIVPAAGADQPGLVAAIGLSDGPKFDQWWKKQAESYQQPTSSVEIEGVAFLTVGEEPPLIGHDPQWLYIADSQENAKKLLSSMKGGGQNLDSLPAFKEGADQLGDLSSGAFMFVPLKNLIDQLKAAGPPGTDETTFTELAALEYVIASSDFAEARVDGFAKISGETELAKQLLTPGTLNSNSLKAISKDVTNVNSLDLKWAINTVLKLAQLSPETRGQAAIAGMGLMSQGDPWAAFQGDLTIAGNASETMVSSLSSNFTAARGQGQLTACKSNLKNIGTAMEMYSTDWSGRYPTTMALLTPNYLKTIPDCPAAGQDTYSASLQTGPDAPRNEPGYQDYYYFCCQGNHHPETPENYPLYNAVEGLDDGGAVSAPEPQGEQESPSTVVVATLKESSAGHAFLNKLLQIGGEPPKEGEEQVYSAPMLMMVPGLSFKITNKGTPMAILTYGPDSQQLVDTSSGDLAQQEIVKEMLSWGKAGIVYLDYMNLEPAYNELVKILKESEDPEAKTGLALLEKLRSRVSRLDGGACLAVRPEGLRYRAQGVSNASFLVAAGAAVAVPNFVRARSQGQTTACKSNLKNIGTALEMYSTDYSGRYPQDISKVTPDYLRSMPQCPAAGRDTYSESYRLEQPDDSQWEVYYVHCSGANHTANGLPPNFPAYNGLEGLTER